MRLKKLITELQKLAKENPEALEMEVFHEVYTDDLIVEVRIGKTKEDKNKVFLVGWTPF
jgi:hypothetical protein